MNYTNSPQSAQALPDQRQPWNGLRPATGCVPLGEAPQALRGVQMFDWMAWTLPVAVFFTCIVLMLIGMTVWEIKSPTTMRKGFLPLETTRGDRLFIGLLSAAYVNLIFVGISGKLVQWFSLSAEPSVWISFVASMALLVLILRKG